jgi:hypothetical protein
MKQGTVKWFVCAVFCGLLIVSCASTRLTETWVDQNQQGKPLSDILVIALTDDEEVRRSFERKFVAQLEALGAEAISSAKVISMPADQKLEKDVILKVVREFQNDGVIITHLVDLEEKEVYTPPPRPRREYYSDYSLVHRYTHEPGHYSSNTLVHLETNLYDAKTEKLVWTGKSETWNPQSDEQMIDEVIRLVIKDLQKKNLLAPK